MHKLEEKNETRKINMEVKKQTPKPTFNNGNRLENKIRKVLITEMERIHGESGKVNRK